MTRSVALRLSLLLVLGACGSVHAARRPELRFVRALDLPNLGLQIQLMPTAKEAPLPPPVMVMYQFHMGDQSWKSEMYAPTELWRESQNAGRWVDEFGNAFVLATVRQPLPGGFKKPHASREEYAREAAAGAKGPEAWTPDELARWAADYTGGGTAQVKRIERHASKLKDLVECTFPAHAARLGYAFRLNPQAAGQYKAPTNWFFAQWDINPAIPLDDARRALQEEFFQNLTVPSASARPPERAAAARNRAGEASTNRSPEFLESRRQVVAGIRNMKDWWYAETPHYIILSDLRSRSHALVMRLQTDLEVLCGVWEKALPPRKPFSAVSVIRVFAGSDEYDAYVAPEYRWTSGLWAPPRRELLIRSVDIGGADAQRERLLRVAYHEAFHQYLFYAFDQITAAAWFNEGHAAFYENAVVRGSTLEIGEGESRARAMDAMAQAGTVAIEPLLRMTYEQFYGKDDEVRQRNYALAWALVYYLRRGAPAEKGAPYAGIPAAYADALWKTRDADAATKAAFEGVNLTVLQQDFLRFWKSPNRRGAAKHSKAM